MFYYYIAAFISICIVCLWIYKNYLENKWRKKMINRVKILEKIINNLEGGSN
jgi:hypothetical protein